jgi:arylsulfatase A-like enzyme
MHLKTHFHGSESRGASQPSESARSWLAALSRCFPAWLLCLTAMALASAPASAMAKAANPNIILIMVDDMGFSDIGCYGGEIPTPNLDRLAAGGVKFTQFYNTGRCCPTRAALLTGLYSHQAGMGWMTTDFGPEYPGFRGRLLEDRITIAEALKPAGYFTAMTGKWHLGQGPKPPAERFDRSLQAMAGGFFYPGPDARLVLNGKRLGPNPPELPRKWYSTDLWTDFGLRFIDEALAEQKPFFLYLAHNAPHFPLQADPEDIARFRGKYKAGWDALSAARYNKQVELGLIDKTWKPASRPEAVPAWDTLSEADKDYFDKLMAIYAACVWRMDRSIGALVEGLKQRGVFDDTLILFLSDNGGNAEGGVRGIARGPGEPGSANSTVFCGESWAWMQNTPFRKFKHYNHEGGIATPLIAHWPKGIKARGEWRQEPAHLIDIFPTFMDVAGVRPGRKDRALPLEGISLRAAFEGKPLRRAQPIFFEHEGNAAVRDGEWKIGRLGYNADWELYNMKSDRTEQRNLARAHPEKVKALAAKWDAWAVRANVKPWPEGIGYPRDGKPPTARKKTEQTGQQ